MSSVVKEKSNVIVVPFGIEADHPRNCDLLLQSIPGVRLRSTILASKPAKDRKTGHMMIPQDQSTFLGQFPPIPGMQLHVNPEKLTYAILDPLEDDEELCRAIERAIRQTGSFSSDSRVRGLPSTRATLDVHRIKTLVREMIQLVESSEARVIKGALPKIEDANKLQGNYLLNPGSRVSNTQPTFEKDWDKWVERMSMSGG